jgi:hypothetical protein
VKQIGGFLKDTWNRDTKDSGLFFFSSEKTPKGLPYLILPLIPNKKMLLHAKSAYQNLLYLEIEKVLSMEIKVSPKKMQLDTDRLMQKNTKEHNGRLLPSAV